MLQIDKKTRSKIIQDTKTRTKLLKTGQKY